MMDFLLKNIGCVGVVWFILIGTLIVGWKQTIKEIKQGGKPGIKFPITITVLWLLLTIPIIVNISKNISKKGLEEIYSEKYNICGKKCFNKEGSGIFKKVQASLSIYLLQDKKEPNKIMISVSQDRGCSISMIKIQSDVLDKPIKVHGKGKYWGDTLVIGGVGGGVPEMTYEKEIFIESDKFKLRSEFKLPLEFNIRVTYWWVCNIDLVEKTFMNCNNTIYTTFKIKI